jgi:tetratricopeptide (TPR) repeat protein
MKKTILKTGFPCLLCAIALLFGSCGSKTDMQTMRLYANAHEMFSMGKFSETAALLNNVKTFPPALILRAKAEYFSGDFDSAEKTCRQAIKNRPASFEAKLCLARVLRDKGETKKADWLAEELLADNSQDMRLLRFAATLAVERGDAAAASALLDQAAELTAEGAMVLLDRARLRWISGRGKEALEDLARAKAMLPWDTPIARSIHQLEKRITEAMQ